MHRIHRLPHSMCVVAHSRGGVTVLLVTLGVVMRNCCIYCRQRGGGAGVRQRAEDQHLAERAAGPRRPRAGEAPSPITQTCTCSATCCTADQAQNFRSLGFDNFAAEMSAGTSTPSNTQQWTLQHVGCGQLPE